MINQRMRGRIWFEEDKMFRSVWTPVWGEIRLVFCG